MPPKTKSDKNKYKTGFCANEQCEGTKPKSFSGQPLKTCEFWQTCPCRCHAQITEMYELTGLDREPPEQSDEYLAWSRAERAKFVMPSLYDSGLGDILSSPGGTDTAPGNERAGAGDVDSHTGTPAAPVPAFAPTPTGRRARGQLEYDVLEVCIDYVRRVFDWEYCTPKLVSEEIGKRHAIEPPSTGAINAVWDRWEKYGFAKQDKKPSRLVAFTTDAPSINALELIKARIKREKKRSVAESKRGTLRPRGR